MITTLLLEKNFFTEDIIDLRTFWSLRMISKIRINDSARNSLIVVPFIEETIKYCCFTYRDVAIQ